MTKKPITRGTGTGTTIHAKPRTPVRAPTPPPAPPPDPWIALREDVRALLDEVRTQTQLLRDHLALDSQVSEEMRAQTALLLQIRR